jgi:hypothetical protein
MRVKYFTAVCVQKSTFVKENSMVNSAQPSIKMNMYNIILTTALINQEGKNN